ncbi:MAG: hypothetical protein R3B48_27900 [Kofleriaceae bacterium]
MLDDGPRRGTEPWRELGGVRFCHWDRWLLRLSLDEPNGLDSIAETFRQRARAPGGIDPDAEAMLAQLSDLELRLSLLRCEPRDVLDERERASQWLHAKAFRRVWHAHSFRDHTEAMQRTPRKLLEARAREGNWSAFPVSPAAHLARLRPIYQHVCVDWRGVGSVVLLLQLEADRMLAKATSTDQKLAVRRAIVGAAIEARAHVHDSGGDFAEHFRDAELAYLDHLGDYLVRPGILRDLLELATWEDYGMFHHIEVFLEWLPERAADLAIHDLARLITELRAAGLDDQVFKAQRLRRLVLTSADKVASSLDAPGGDPEARP